MKLAMLSSLLLVSTFLFIGCGESSNSEIAYNTDPPMINTQDYVSKSMTASNDSPASVSTDEDANATAEVGNPTDSELTDNSSSETPVKKSIDRKIIYNASVRIVVKDFDPIEQELRNLVVQHNGFVANSNVDKERGEYRSGNWTARIPVDGYPVFLSQLGNLGSITSQSENGQDVTEEFVDLNARITNKQKLEERIISLLENRDDNIKNVIAVEQELARVREDIERMQGRLRYLGERSSLATVSIYAVEQRDFKPVEAMSFGEKISNTWSDSIGTLISFGKNVLLLLVAIGPWAIVAMLILFPIYTLLRRAFWRMRAVEG